MRTGPDTTGQQPQQKDNTLMAIPTSEPGEKEARTALYAAIVKEARKIEAGAPEYDYSERLENLARAFAFTARPAGSPRGTN